jgi:hypothetical protein
MRLSWWVGRLVDVIAHFAGLATLKPLRVTTVP